MALTSVCVFCGSSWGASPVYAESARHVGRLLAQRGITLVYGGGNVGLMGAVADAALKNGGSVIGVIPKALADKELAHEGITKLHVVGSMHERKAMMAELADAFIALPGGYGTLEEFCEIVTWCQLGIHQKPCGVLNVDGYFDALLQQFDHGVAEQFIRPRHRQLIVAAHEPETLLTRLMQHRAPTLEKWIGKSET